MIRPFTDADVDAAAELLAERHARHRAAEPLLPADVDFRAQIESEWAVDGAAGVISDRGYLFGRPMSAMDAQSSARRMPGDKLLLRFFQVTSDLRGR